MTENKNLNSYLITVFSIVIVLIAWYAIDVLLLTFAAILFAIFLRILNNLIKKFVHLPDILSMSLVIGIIFILFTMTTIFMTPVINEQIHNLSQDIPGAWDKFKQMLSSTLNLDSVSSIYQKLNVQNLLPHGKNFLLQAANIFSSTFGLIGSLLVVIVMGIFLAYDPKTYKEGFISLIPSSKQEKADNIIESIGDILQWWVIGKIFSMFFVGILTLLGLWFLSIPMALTLGLIAAILTFIPNIGPIISAIPAILIAFTQNPRSALYVIALYSVIQAIEGYIVTPLIQGKTIALPPALVIFSQLIMGLLTGFLGLSLATPLLAALSVIIKKSYIENNTNKIITKESNLY